MRSWTIMSFETLDCFTAASHALAYAEEYFTRFKDGSYNNQDGYAIQRISCPDDEGHTYYIGTFIAPTEILTRIEYAAKAAALPEGQPTQALAEEFMIRTHETLCRAWVLADQRARRHDFSAEMAKTTIDSALSGIKSAIHKFEERQAECAPS